MVCRKREKKKEHWRMLLDDLQGIVDTRHPLLGSILSSISRALPRETGQRFGKSAPKNTTFQQDSANAYTIRNRNLFF